MHATNVRNLKKNPSLALRQAEDSPVLVLKGDKPNALIVHMDNSFTETTQSVKPALAAALFKDGVVSLGAAVRVSGTPMQYFLNYLEELGIDVVCPDETTQHETPNLDQWLAQ